MPPPLNDCISGAYASNSKPIQVDVFENAGIFTGNVSSQVSRSFLCRYITNVRFGSVLPSMICSCLVFCLPSISH